MAVEDLLEDSELSERLNEIFNDYFKQHVPIQEHSECKDKLRKLARQIRLSYYLLPLTVLKKIPTNPRRRDALVEVATCADTLNKALKKLAANGFFFDLHQLQPRIEKLQSKHPSPFKWPFSSLIGTSFDRHVPNNPLLSEIDGITLVKFSYKKTGFSQLLTTLRKAAKRNAEAISDSEGGYAKNYLKQVIADKAAELFRSCKFKVNSSNSKFRGFLNEMFLLATGEDHQFLEEMREFAKPSKKRVPLTPKS